MEETVHLLEFQGSDAMFCLDSIESPRALRVGARSGMTLPPYASAAGRSILALLPEEEVRAMYPSASFPARHPATITKRSQLLAELDKARARGYAVQRSETEDGISAVAAAIEQDGVRPRFAVTVAVPTSRLTDEEVPTIGAAVVACAAAISASLGA
jgi:DNA-binding IclR family transcriptional regulator